MKKKFLPLIAYYLSILIPAIFVSYLLGSIVLFLIDFFLSEKSRFIELLMNTYSKYETLTTILIGFVFLIFITFITSGFDLFKRLKRTKEIERTKKSKIHSKYSPQLDSETSGEKFLKFMNYDAGAFEKYIDRVSNEIVNNFKNDLFFSKESAENILQQVANMLVRDGFSYEEGANLVLFDKRKLNCFGYSMVYFSIGEKLNLPLKLKGNLQHVLIRWESGSVSFDWEATSGRVREIDSQVLKKNIENIDNAIETESDYYKKDKLSEIKSAYEEYIARVEELEAKWTKVQDYNVMHSLFYTEKTSYLLKKYSVSKNVNLLKEASINCQKAIQADLNNIYAQRNFIWILMEKNELEDAKRLIDNMLTQFSSEPILLQLKASYFAKIGRAKDSIKYYRKSIKEYTFWGTLINTASFIKNHIDFCNERITKLRKDPNAFLVAITERKDSLFRNTKQSEPIKSTKSTDQIEGKILSVKPISAMSEKFEISGLLKNIRSNYHIWLAIKTKNATIPKVEIKHEKNNFAITVNKDDLFLGEISIYCAMSELSHNEFLTRVGKTDHWFVPESIKMALLVPPYEEVDCIRLDTFKISDETNQELS